MKNNNRSVLLFVSLFLISLLAIGAFQGGVIKGTVSAPDAVTNVWAITGRDTFSGSVVDSAFEISKLQNGTYSVVIETEPPYKRAMRKNVQVKNGAVIDVGAIILEK
jgi:hypothetical protein